MKSKPLFLFILLFILTGCSSNNQYSLTLLDENDNVYQVLSNLNQDDEIPLPRLEKENHLFIGWSNGDQVYYSQFEGTKDVTLTPVYEKYTDVFTYEMVEASSGIIITEYTGSGEHVHLPISIEGYHVLGLGSFAFKDTLVTDLYFHDFITTLKPRALHDTPHLENIHVSELNETFNDVNGVLFSLNGTLIQYPQGKKDTHFEAPNITKQLGPYSFVGQKYLETLTLPESLTHIGNHAMAETLNLTSLTIPSSVIFIGAFFTNDSEIERVIILRNYEEHGSITVIDSLQSEDLPIFYVPDDSLSFYQADLNWVLFYEHIRSESELN